MRSKSRHSATELRASILRSSFADFVGAFWSVVERGPLEPNLGLDAVVACLQALGEGRIRRLAISQPPGTLKSTLSSVLFPAWLLARDPHHRSLHAANTHALAERDSRRCRLVVESEDFARLFGVGLAPDLARSDHWATTAGGERLALGTGGNVTGWRGNLVAVDDPLDAAGAYSDASRESANRWWDEVMSTRLLDARTDKMLVVAQRLHLDDLCGHLAEQGAASAGTAWHFLSLPLEHEPEHACEVRDDAGALVWRDTRTGEGELLSPRFTPEVAADLRVRLGSYAYSAQYQQRPVPIGGGLFKREWFKSYARRDTYAAYSIGLDCSFTDAATSDFVAAVVVGVPSFGLAERHVLEVVRERASFTRTVEIVKALSRRYPGAKITVEKAANGHAIIDQLRREVSGVVGETPKGSKEARAFSVQPMCEAKQVMVPESAPWLRAFLDEVAVFPRGKHDDQVDALVWALLGVQMTDDMRTGWILSGGWRSLLAERQAAESAERERVAEERRAKEHAESEARLDKVEIDATEEQLSFRRERYSVAEKRAANERRARLGLSLL
jgi:predicted phage terminase large subunit-like protein